MNPAEGSASVVPCEVGAVCVLDDALLLVRYGHGPAAGEWNVPRVRVRPGEASAEAVVRSTVELAGCETLCGPFLSWTEQPESDSPVVTLFFEAVVLDPRSVSVGAPDDSPATEALFVPMWEVSELRLADGLGEFLAEHGIIDLVL